MKRSKLIAVVIGIIFIVIGGIMSVCAVASLGMDYFKGKGHEIIYLDDDFSSIEISSDMCDVWIFSSDENARRIDYSLFGDVEISIKVVDGALKISSVDNRKWYDYIGIVWSDSPHISVYLPPEEYNSLSIKISSGDVNVPDKISFDDVNIKNTSGDIRFYGDVKKSLSLETTSGDITITNTNLNLKKTIIKTLSGDIGAFSIVASSEIKIETTSGDIEVNSIVSSSEIEMKTTSGDVEFASIDAPKIQLKTTSGDIEGTVATKKHIIARTTSGDINVQSDDFADEICNAETTSGDIKIRVD